MKKIIPFSKNIKFNTKIYEITSISLENTLSIEDNGEISGEFIVSGDYKMNDTSINTEPFIYGLPFNITLDEYYDTDKIKIDIDDFKYEIINEEVLKVDIDVMIEGTIKLEEKEEKEDNNIQPDIIIDARKMKEETKEDIPKKDYIDIIDEESESMQLEKDLFKESDGNVKEVINQNDNEKDTINQNDNLQVTSIFENFDSSEDKYISYYVHIVRENENIEEISMKYNISLEDLKEYNNMDEITLGSKIIIPYINNDQTI